jgi:hypothetical protein
MLNWLSTKFKQEEKSDHPLGTDAGLQQMLSELTPQGSERNLHELGEWLAEPSRLSSGMSPARTVQIIQRLDEVAQGSLAGVWKEFLAENKTDHLGEQKLKTLDRYYQAALASNRHAALVVTQNPALGGSAAGAGNLISVLVARALRAHVAMARIQHMRYRSPDAAWWKLSAELLALASKAEALNLVQATYPGETPPSSPWLEHLLGLFFEIAPLGNCNPRQMDLLNRVLRKLEPHFMVRDSFAQQAPYHTRLDQVGPPKKLTGSLAPDPNNVYFGPGMSYGHLIRLRGLISTSNPLPDWLAGSLCSPEAVIALLDALVMQWSDRPPQRLAKRASRTASIRTTHGLAQIRRMIAFSEFARSGRKVGYTSHFEMLKFERRGFADVTAVATEDDATRWGKATPLETLEILETAGDRQMMDDWTMQDESETGIGAIAPFLKPWMVIGAFVGYRVEDEVDWQIGILRRLHRKESGHPSAGLEVFTEAPVCAQVKELKVVPGTSPLTDLHKDSPMQGFQDAIVLSQAKGLLLIPKGLFAQGRYLALIVGGYREAIRMRALTHSDADCDCIQYETLDD